MADGEVPRQIPFHDALMMRAGHLADFLQHGFVGFAADRKAAEIIGFLLAAHMTVCDRQSEKEELRFLWLDCLRQEYTEENIKSALSLAESDGVLCEIAERKWPEEYVIGDPTPPWKPLANWHIGPGENLPPRIELLALLPALEIETNQCEAPRADDDPAHWGDVQQAIDLVETLTRVRYSATVFRNWISGRNKAPVGLVGIMDCADKVRSRWKINLAMLQGLVTRNQSRIGDPRQVADKPTRQSYARKCSCGKGFDPISCPDCGRELTEECPECHPRKCTSRQTGPG